MKNNIIQSGPTTKPNFTQAYTPFHAKIAINLTSAIPNAYHRKKYEHKRSIKTIDDRNALFSHMLEFKHRFFFQGSPNQTDSRQNLSKTNRTCSHIQYKQYKTTCTFLPNLIASGEHHTERKQN